MFNIQPIFKQTYCMKVIALLAIVILSSFGLKAQTKEVNETYCILLIMEMKNDMSRLFIKADFGSDTTTANKAAQKEVREKKTIVDALNVMGKNGWQLTQTVTIVDEFKLSHTQYIFKKDSEN
jgi:hypothetical protein